MLDAFRTSGNIVGREPVSRGYKLTKESIVAGPYGVIKMTSVWEHSWHEPYAAALRGRHRPEPSIRVRAFASTEHLTTTEQRDDAVRSDRVMGPARK